MDRSWHRSRPTRPGHCYRTGRRSGSQRQRAISPSRRRQPRRYGSLARGRAPERLLCRIRRISLRLEDDAGAVECALLREAGDEVALLAPATQACGVAGGFDDAGGTANRCGDELDHRILEVEAPARALLILGSLELQALKSLAELFIETHLPLLLQLEH